MTANYWVQVYGPNIRGGPFGLADEHVVESLDDIVRGDDGSLVITTPARQEFAGALKPQRTVTYKPGQVVRFVTGEIVRREPTAPPERPGR